MNFLPEECIVQVLMFAASTPQSLHSLLLTSKTLFRLTAAVLYHSPFKYLERHVSDVTEKQSRQVKVLRLFLACIPETLDALTTSSEATNGSAHSLAASLPGFRKPTIDYLTLYNCHFEQQLHFLISRALSCIPSAHVHPQIQSRKLLPGLPCVHGRIHRGLIGHSPQYIHTIGYSIHGIATLMPIVDRLSRLIRLELYKKADRSEISTAAEFILAHRRAHHSLQEIKIKTKLNDQADLTSLIQAMGRPRLIDVSSWGNADLHLHLFPLQNCRTLLMRQGHPRSLSDLPVDILARLTSVQVLRITAFHQNMFSWATVTNSGANTKNSMLEKRFVPPSITYISLYGLDLHMVPAFTNAVAAFHATLQTLIGLSIFDKASMVGLSWSRSLPRLTRLDLQGTVALRFDLGSLVHCPVLRDLRLNIGRQIPEDWNPTFKATQLAQVSPSVRLLELSGWWRLSDECFTKILLPVFERLRTLNIMWCDGPKFNTVLQLVVLLPSLRRFDVIATSEDHRRFLDYVSLHNPDLEVDVHIKDE